MASKQDILEYLEEVHDPEIPVLSIQDLGILRNVEINGDETLITITPTYTGCPAMNVIESDIKSKLKEKGVENFKIKTALSPAWTTDWLTETGRKKLKEFGIAPPEKGSPDKGLLMNEQEHVTCPHCGSKNTEMKSFFGSTPCKSLYICHDCKEPFDYFKCH